MLRRYGDALPRVPAWGYPALLAVAVGWPFLVSRYWVFLGAAACLFAIGALGLTVLVGWAGQVSLAQASLIGTAVYLSGYAARDDGWGWPLLPAMAVGIAVAVILSCVVSLPTARMSGIYVMVLTLGLQVTIQRTVFTYPELSGSLRGSFLSRPRFLGVSFESDRAYYFLVLAVLGAVIVGLTLFRASRHGRAMLLVKTDSKAAAAVGISPFRYKIIAFALAGLMAGIAGGLTAPLYLSPPSHTQYVALASLLYLAVPVVAGFESLLALVAVAFVVVMLPQALEGLHLSAFVLGGAGLLAATYVGPRGLGGSVLDYLERRRQPPDHVPVGARPRVAPGRSADSMPPLRRPPVGPFPAGGWAHRPDFGGVRAGAGPIRLRPRPGQWRAGSLEPNGRSARSMRRETT